LLNQDKMNLAEKIITMDNGCVCCTIRGDLEDGLMQMVDAIKKGQNIEQIVLETTGMADPVPIVRTFMGAENVTRELRLDAVISMADAKHLADRLDEDTEEGQTNVAYQQVAFADKIILNKLDLVTTEQAIALKDRIRGINKFARVLGAIKGRVRLSELLNIRAHDMVNFADMDIDAEGGADLGYDQNGEHGGGGHANDGIMEVGHGSDHGGMVVDGHGDHGGHGGHGSSDGGHGGHGGGDSGHGGGGGHIAGGSPPVAGHGTSHGTAHGTAHGAGHGHGGNTAARHDTRVNSFALMKEGEIVPRRLDAWMRTLGKLPKEKGILYRVKAILAIKGHPYKHVFHAVMDISDEDDAGPWAEGEKKLSKIVFIGKSMDRKYLIDGFESIFE